HGLSPLAIRRFDRAYMLAFAAHDDDAPASRGLLGMGTLGHAVKDNGRRVRRRVCSTASRMPPRAQKAARRVLREKHGKHLRFYDTPLLEAAQRPPARRSFFILASATGVFR